MVQRKEGAENGVASWGGPGGNTAQTRGLSGGWGAADPGGRAGVLCLEGTHLNRCGSDGKPDKIDGRDPVPPRTPLLSGEHAGFAKMVGFEVVAPKGACRREGTWCWKGW